MEELADTKKLNIPGTKPRAQQRFVINHVGGI